MILLSYFGEKETKRCGKCDVCLERNKLELSEREFDIALEIINPYCKKSLINFLQDIVVQLKLTKKRLLE